MPDFYFDYVLPPQLIAQTPAEPRDSARLLVLEHSQLHHHTIADLPTLLKPGDLVVFNDTKVIRARLLGTRAKTGGKWEGLYLRTTPEGYWELLAQTRGYVQPGEFIRVNNGPLEVELKERTDEKHWLVKPNLPGSAAELLETHGHVPLPPYIRKGLAQDTDTERYQTVYARTAGSVAAPTAGLHFTPKVLAELSNKGIQTATVTLHVGLGTFAPVKAEDPTKHQIHSEWCQVTEETVQVIQQAKAMGGRVIAVGTTTVRTLETAAQTGTLKPFQGESSIYIYPPYSFRVIDGLLTNFHLPRTTLLLMVQALCGPERLKLAYETAIAKEYRFYSYGDAMLILNSYASRSVQ